MRQYDEATTVGEADAPLEEESALLAPKIRPTPVTPVGAPMTPAPAALPPIQAAPPPPVAAPPAPMPTLSGDWQAPVASATSAPLIASAAGGTMTPQGDASNPFKGYETDQGGKFGGYDRVPLVNDAAGRTFKTYDQDFVKNANALKQVPPLSREEFAAMTATDSGANAVKDKIANGQPVTDKELAFVRQARGMELQQDTAAPTFGTFGTKTGTATAANPAEQEAGLAAQGLPPIAPAPAVAPPSAPVGAPAGSPTGAPAPAPAPSVGGVVATPQKVATVPTQPMGAGAGALPGIGAAPSGAFTKTPTDPNNALTDQTLDYGDLTDRFKVAQSELENWNKTSDPQFQADLRDAMRKAAAGGALGSGMLQTSLGDITSNRELQRQGMGKSFLNNALTGSIQDAKDRTGLAERQQGFQADQQRTAFGQGVTEAQLNENLTGGAFQRALQSLTAGSNGNPADIQLALSQIFGNQGANASNALSGLISGKTANSGATSSGGYFADLLKKILGGGGGAPAPDSTVVYGGQ